MRGRPASNNALGPGFPLTHAPVRWRRTRESETDMFQRGSFLLAAEDEIMAHTLRAPMQRYAVVRWTAELDQVGTTLNGAEHWAGLVIDLDPIEDRALGYLGEIRTANALLPILAISSRPVPELMNGCHALRVELVCKPLDSSNLTSFVQRALVHSWLPDGRVFGQYQILANGSAGTSATFTAHGYTDLDRDGNYANYSANRQLQPWLITPPNVY